MKITILLLLIFSALSVFPQNSFISCKENRFYNVNSDYYFLGFSAYYLQWMASDSSKQYIVDDVFKIAYQTGIGVIRTWGFNSGSDSLKQSVIRYSPYGLNERGLKALDYVVYQAKMHNIKVILTLENNFQDFGGIDQYVSWAHRYLKPNTGKTYKHDDFFTDDSLKNWYKFYVSTILNRINTLTGIRYKEEPIIFSFELMNEASDTGFPVSHIKNWYMEMSCYFKSIDSNHLLTTGEIGYDFHKEEYSDVDMFYNSSYFLFNGYKGTSFVENTSINDIDYSSFHMYPDAWNFEYLAGNTWINDHNNISNGYIKPALLGEFGVINEKVKNYKIYLQTVRDSPSKSAIIWDYVHPDLMNIADKYAFNEVNDPGLFDLLKNHLNLLIQDSLVKIINDFNLYQNYPNPFNPSTTIQYSLKKTALVKIELYNSLGQLIKIIENGIRKAGSYRLYLSFDNNLLGSGVYFYRMQAGNFAETKKMILLK
ncbi:MAG TPA: T9SS type A sorting domain-containing protein [Ignavibacteriaceae bacterium]|nr:T9SS type A sorting domain-containing protein [Ignavibacteriaceae bacterium]